MDLFEPSFRIARKPLRLHRVELTALMDVAFLLLIFVILTSSYVVRPVVDVSLPNVGPAGTAPPGKIVLQIPASPREMLYLSGEPVEEGTLAEHLMEIYLTDRDTSILIAPDRRAPVERFLQIIRAVRDAGFRDIRIAVEEEQEEDSGL